MEDLGTYGFVVFPGLAGCWAGVFFCLCELWTWSDFLRHLLFTDRLLRNLSPSVLPRICFSFFFFCEKMKKSLSVKCYCVHITQCNTASRCLFFIWHSHTTCSFYGKDAMKWRLLASEDEVKQESCRKIIGADQVKKNKSPWVVLVMQSQLYVHKKRKLLRSQWLKGNPFRPPVWPTYPNLDSL